MARLKLNKSVLASIHKDLSTYRQYLPALELRRQHLLLTRQLHQKSQLTLDDNIRQLNDEIKLHMVMMSQSSLDLSTLLSIDHIELVHENIAGVKLPKLEKVHFDVQTYSVELTPNWLESALEYLQKKISFGIQQDINKERETILNQAIMKTSQRINLFEKVLIPQAEEDIKKIQIALSDEATSAVVRAKLCKKLSATQSTNQSK